MIGRMNVFWIIFLVTLCTMCIQGSSIDYQKIREDVKPSLVHGLLVHEPPVAKRNEKLESGVKTNRRHAKHLHPHTRKGKCFDWLFGSNVDDDIIKQALQATTYNPIYDLDPRMNLLYPSQAYLYFPYAYSNSRSSNHAEHPNSASHKNPN